MKRPAVFLVLALVLAGLLWRGSALFETGTRTALDPEQPAAGETPAAEPDVTGVGSQASQPDRTRTEPELPRSAGEVVGSSVTTGALLLRTALPDGTPVPRAVVYVSPEGARRIGHETTEHVTDDAGLVRVEELDPGKVAIFCPRGPRKSVEVVAGEATEVLLEFRNVVAVRGLVRDPDGRPIAGADVWLAAWRRDWLGTRHVTRTKADGTFVAGYVHKEKSLGATADGFAPSALVDLDLVDTERSLVAIELVVRSGGGNLRGRVFDHEGRPVAGARVAVGEPPGDYSMRSDGTVEEFWCPRVDTTDDSGSFAFTGLDAGRLPMHVAASRHPAHADEVEILADATVNHDVRLAPGMSVRGLVEDDAGDVVPGALVLALDAPFVDPFPTQGPTDRGAPFHRPASRSDDRGAYRLDHLPAGEVHLYASKGTSYWDDGQFLGSVQESLSGAAGETLEWNPVLSRGHAIRGRVLYADGSPMGNVFVSATDDDDRRYTEHAGEEGVFAIPGLENRAYRVSVQLWDEPDDARPLEQEDVWPSNVELVLTASYSRVVEEKGAVSVRIDDRAKRIEGKGAVVFAHDRGWYFSDEHDGVFRTELPPGRYQARAMSGDAVVGSTDWFDLAPGEERDLGSIQTRRSASVLVSVIRPPELAANVVLVSCETDERPRTGGRKLAEGEDELAFEDLLEGPAEVKVWGVGVAQESRAVEVRAAAPTTVEFRLRAAAKTAIRVESATTEGFGLLELILRRADGSVYSEIEYHERWGAELPVQAAPFVPLGRFTVEATTTSGLSAKGELDVNSLTAEATLTLVLE